MSLIDSFYELHVPLSSG